jgi:homoserine dehydrogenase
MKLAILGVGSVGKTVAQLSEEYGHSVVAMADSKNAIVNPTGVDVGVALEQKSNQMPLGDASLEDVFESNYDVLIEATPTTLKSAEPAFSHIKMALETDRHVVLANKGPVAERFEELQSIADGSKGTLRFEATVGGAIPVLSTIEDINPKTVTSVKGILNGTSNFILTRMAAKNLSYSHVLSEAQELGVAEADPIFDVGGIDTALKCVIISNVLSGGGFRLSDAEVEGIQHISNHALNLADKSGLTIRLVGEATREGVNVAPMLVPKTEDLAVEGTQNIVQIATEHGGILSLAGPGAGGDPTASAIFLDLQRLIV